jgi:hypothetical protein
MPLLPQAVRQEAVVLVDVDVDEVERLKLPGNCRLAYARRS